MHIGRFDRRIYLTKNNEANYQQDEYGGLTESVAEPTEAIALWAEVKQDAGGEKDISGKVTTVQSVLFIVRYATGITVNARIAYDDKTYIVESYREIFGRKRYLEIKARGIDGI